MKKLLIATAMVALLVTGIYVGTAGFPWDKKEGAVETVTDVSDKNAESQGKLKIAGKSAVVMEATSGDVIYEENAHKELPPASVTKVMTMLLAMENIKAGKIKMDDKVTISERAASMGGSQMYMEVGEEHTVEELLKGIAIVSANDACVALAEYIAGSDEIFVEQMNQKAKEIGMRDTNFVNTNGLPVANHYTSAYDIALMSQKLLKYQEPREWFSTWETTITIGLPGKEKEFGLTNTNKLIKQYPGAIGIKTGFTQDAGYCLSAAAEKNGTTIIAVVMGCETSKTRLAEVKKLLDYGFSMYSTEIIAEKGKVMARCKLNKADVEEVDLVAKETIKASYNKNQKGEIETKIKVKDDIKLPIKKGQELGKVYVYKGKEQIGTYPLITEKGAKHASFGQLYIRIAKKWL